MENITTASNHLKQGHVIAYPTEAVFGLGCDPMNEAAVMRLLSLKQREADKGLILIAAGIKQYESYIDDCVFAQYPEVMKSWPGPHTWLVPCRTDVPYWIRGQHDTLAIRVTAHAMCVELCNAFGGAIVSTSANLSSLPPALNADQVKLQFHDQIDYILEGETDKLEAVTSIRDARSGEQLR